MSRSYPRVFTEQGIAMLSTILKSKVAVETSIRIMDAFVKMRKYISANLIEQDNMKNMLIKHDNEIKLFQKSFSKLEEKEKQNGSIGNEWALQKGTVKEKASADNRGIGSRERNNVRNPVWCSVGMWEE